MSEREDLEAAQAIEYGTYRAIAPIDFDGVRAFNPGHPVPVSHVEAYGYDDAGLVERVDTKPAAKKSAPVTTEKG